MSDGTRITVDDNGVVRELPDWAAWRQAIGAGFLVPPRPVTVYRPGMPPQTMPAGAVPELQPLFAELAPPGAWQGGPRPGPGTGPGGAMPGGPPPYQVPGYGAPPPSSGGGAGKIIIGVVAAVLLVAIIAGGALYFAVKRSMPNVTTYNTSDSLSNATVNTSSTMTNTSAADTGGAGGKGGDGTDTTTTAPAATDTTASSGSGDSGFQATYRTQFIQRCTAAVPQSQSDAAGLDMPTICSCAADKLLASQTQEQLTQGPSQAAQTQVTQECLQEHPPRQ